MHKNFLINCFLALIFQSFRLIGKTFSVKKNLYIIRFWEEKNLAPNGADKQAFMSLQFYFFSLKWNALFYLVRFYYEPTH